MIKVITRFGINLENIRNTFHCAIQQNIKIVKLKVSLSFQINKYRKKMF